MRRSRPAAMSRKSGPALDRGRDLDIGDEKHHDRQRPDHDRHHEREEGLEPELERDDPGGTQPMTAPPFEVAFRSPYPSPRSCDRVTSAT